jgi:uncharacterized protein YqeY
MYKKLGEDLKIYMKNSEKEKVSVLRMLLSQIKNEAIRIGIKDISDEIVFNVLKRSIKEIEDNIINYTQLGKMELVDKEKFELSMLKSYMPEQISDEELINLVKKEIDSIKNFSQKDMGSVITSITTKFKFQVDSARIAKIIKEKYL